MVQKIKKAFKHISPLISAILLTLIAVGVVFVFIGFISFLINVVCVHQTTLFQRLSFYIALAIGVFVTWYCLVGKED